MGRALTVLENLAPGPGIPIDRARVAAAAKWKAESEPSSQKATHVFHEMMIGAVRVKTFGGAVGTATVWKLGAKS